jgi:hypothetical protein
LINEKAEIMSLSGRRMSFKGRAFSSKCLSCTDLTNCCGMETEFDGATPSKNLGLSRRDALKILGGVSAVLAAAPFIAGGQYLIPQISTNFQPVLIAKKGDVPVNGSEIFLVPFHNGSNLHEHVDSLATGFGAAGRN